MPGDEVRFSLPRAQHAPAPLRREDPAKGKIRRVGTSCHDRQTADAAPTDLGAARIIKGAFFLAGCLNPLLLGRHHVIFFQAAIEKPNSSVALSSSRRPTFSAGPGIFASGYGTSSAHRRAAPACKTCRSGKCLEITCTCTSWRRQCWQVHLLLHHSSALACATSSVGLGTSSSILSTSASGTCSLRKSIIVCFLLLSPQSARSQLVTARARQARARLEIKKKKESPHGKFSGAVHASAFVLPGSARQCLFCFLCVTPTGNTEFWTRSCPADAVAKSIAKHTTTRFRPAKRTHTNTWTLRSRLKNKAFSSFPPINLIVGKPSTLCLVQNSCACPHRKQVSGRA